MFHFGIKIRIVHRKWANEDGLGLTTLLNVLCKVFKPSVRVAT